MLFRSQEINLYLITTDLYTMTQIRSTVEKYQQYNLPVGKPPIKSSGSTKRLRALDVSSDSRLSSLANAREHVKHFVLCLSDAFSFREPMKVVEKVSVRLIKLFPDYPLEKIFKWYYGNSLGWSANILTDIARNPKVDALGIDSSDCFAATKVFGGRLMRFLQAFFRRQQRHTMSQAWARRKAAFSKAQTFLMFKKGAPQVSETLIQEADQKHKEAMGNAAKGHSHRRQNRSVKNSIVTKVVTFVEADFKKHPSPIKKRYCKNTRYLSKGEWGLLDEDDDKLHSAMLRQKLIETSAREIIHRLFKPNSFNRVLKKEVPLFPSTSAHVEKSAARKHGGAVNIVKKFFNKPQKTGDLESMSYHPRTGVIEHFSVNYPESASRIANSLLDSQFNAVPVYLQEPLKVRTITKGPSSPYWIFRPIQKFLWSTIQRHPVFELIGTPIKSELLEKMLPFRNPEGSWLSGDYSAATDNLVRWLSKFIWSEICLRTGISDEFYRLGLKGLVDHTIKYEDGTIIRQRNGQLMGSPLSFPILCIANAAICLLAFDKKRRNIDACALRVNGDDCVMCYTQEERDRWSALAEFIGMSPSPGKCYYAKDWLQMNSELFVQRSESKFSQIPFINFSLASPTLAKGGLERGITSLQQTMENFCLGRSSRFIDIWIRRMFPYLREKVPGLISWYLPQCLGGLGLMTKYPKKDPKLGEKPIFSTRQLAVATLFYNNAIEGKESPYALSDEVTSEANYRKLGLNSHIVRRARFQEVPSVKTFWADKYFKEKDKVSSMTPLLWENLIKNDLFVTSRNNGDVLNNKICAVFNKDSRQVNPLPLERLLSLRGVDLIIPNNLYESSYEPRGIFEEVSARISGLSSVNFLKSSVMCQDKASVNRVSVSPTELKNLEGSITEFDRLAFVYTELYKADRPAPRNYKTVVQQPREGIDFIVI